MLYSYIGIIYVSWVFNSGPSSSPELYPGEHINKAGISWCLTVLGDSKKWHQKMKGKQKCVHQKFHLIVLWMITTLPMSQILFKNKIKNSGSNSVSGCLKYPNSSYTSHYIPLYMAMDGPNPNYTN